MVKEDFLKNIPILNLTEFEFLCEGGCSTVYKAKMKEFPIEKIKSEEPKEIKEKFVIVKIIGSIWRKYADREIHFLNNNKHENIIKLIDYSQNDEYSILILEYFYNKDLLDYYNEIHDLSKQSKYIILQLTKAILYLHQNNITHNDIKPENILFNPETRKIALIDFGFSKKHNNRPILVRSRKGTEMYVAPEVKTIKVYDPYKADIFSLGVIFFFCIKNKIPRNYEKSSRFCPMLIKNMLSYVPEIRPNIEFVYDNLYTIFN